jgi:hypothetical protein
MRVCSCGHSSDAHAVQAMHRALGGVLPSSSQAVCEARSTTERMRALKPPWMT